MGSDFGRTIHVDRDRTYNGHPRELPPIAEIEIWRRGCDVEVMIELR